MMNFDVDDDEFIPFSEKSKLSSQKKKKKKWDSWLGEEDVDEDGDDGGFGFAGFLDEGGVGGGGGFVSGGGLQDQLKKKKEEKKEETKPESSSSSSSKKKKQKKAEATPLVPESLSKGASLLAKMGWGGGGVGKREQGITVALEVKARPANAGLGMIEEKTDAMKKVERQRRGEDVSDSEDEEEDDHDARNASAVSKAAKTKVDRSQAWKKAGGKKVQIKSAYDILREEAEAAPEAKLTIVDLTGATERITDVKSLAAYERERAAANYKIGLGKEMRYNLDKLADLAEVELKQSSRLEAQLQKKQETFTGQVATLRKSLADCEAMVSQMQEAQNLVNRLVDASPQIASAASISDEATVRMMAQMSKTFQGASSRFGELYSRLRMPELLYAIIEGSLTSYFSKPGAFLDPERGKAMMESVRPLLESYTSKEQGLDYWSLLQLVSILPPLRSFLSREWDCKNQPHLVVDLVQAWQTVWTEDLLHHVMFELVLRKLAHLVENWDAFTDEIPLHSWIHPWLPLMSHALEQLYPVVVAKLTVALADWDAEDMSAHALLQPWHLCFSSSQMENLAQTRIIPKLAALASSKMQLTPGRHDYRPCLDAILVWHDFIPPISFLKLLVRSVFPRVYRSVYQWALSQRPSGATVIAWYKDFKSAFPVSLFKNAKICILFAHLLDVLLNVLVDKQTQFEPEILLVDLFSDERATGAEPKSTAHLPVRRPQPLSGAAPSDPVSFKAMVESFASERGILFVPLKHRTTNDGKPVYSFGGIAIYLANQLVYAELAPGKWSMVSLEHLAQMTAPRSSKEPIDVD